MAGMRGALGLLRVYRLELMVGDVVIELVLLMIMGMIGF